MRVIAVPSVRNRPAHIWARATETVPNLFEVQPEKYGLEPFPPKTAGVVSLVSGDIVRVKGEVSTWPAHRAWFFDNKRED